MPITYIMDKKDMTTLSSKQVKMEKERIDYGEFLLHNHNERFKMNPITFQEGLEIVRVMKDEFRLRELRLAREKELLNEFKLRELRLAKEKEKASQCPKQLP
jgi:hypothetical protein